MKFLTIAAAVAALALSGAGAAQAAVSIANGSFEVGPVPGAFTTLFAGDTSITGWTVGGDSIDYIGSYWQPGDGHRSLDLAGNGPGSISQLLTGLNTGSFYDVSFLLAGNPDGGGATKVAVATANGVQSQTFNFVQAPNTKTNMGWVAQTYRFQALASTATLSFAADPGAGAYGAALDNVGISAAVPEPATWAMMIMGFGGMGTLLRRRRTLALA